MTYEKPERVRIGGLWKHETRNGITFLSGGLSYDSMFEIWPNNSKREGKNDPDYQIFIAQKVRKDPNTPKPADPMEDVRFSNHNDVPF